MISVTTLCPNFATQGLVDVEKELAKLSKNKGKIEGLMGKLVKKRSTPTYSTKVPVKIQEEEAAKISAYEVELDALDKAAAGFAALRC